MKTTKGGVFGYSDSSATADTAAGGQGGASGSTSGTMGTTSEQGRVGGDQGTPGSQSPFQHRMLKTMTDPMQVDQYVTTLENTIREQGIALRSVGTAQQQPATTQQPPAQQEQVKFPSKEEYWNDPVRATQQVVGHAISEALERQLAPLTAELRTARTELVQPNMWQRLRDDKTSFPHFTTAEQNIRAYLQQINKLGAETEADIRQAYFSVVGWMFQNGLLQNEQPTQVAQPSSGGTNNNSNQGQGNVMMFPQHSASSQPLPNQSASGGGGPRLRDLTEHERSLARMQYPNETPERQKVLYLSWIEEPAANVVTSNIGREQQQNGGGAK